MKWVEESLKGSLSQSMMSGFIYDNPPPPLPSAFPLVNLHTTDVRQSSTRAATCSQLSRN